MNDAPYDNLSMRKGVDDYTGNSKGRRGGQPLLIRPDKYRQLIGGFFWATLNSEGDEIFIEDGYVMTTVVDITSYPPVIASAAQFISDDTGSVVPGDVMSLKMVYQASSGSPSEEIFQDNSANDIHSRQVAYHAPSFEYVVTAGFPTTTGVEQYYPIAGLRADGTLIQYHTGILLAPFMFASSVSAED